ARDSLRRDIARHRGGLELSGVKFASNDWHVGEIDAPLSRCAGYQRAKEARSKCLADCCLVTFIYPHLVDDFRELH
ncbi:MAG: hypothetical protein WAK55_24245, partial [Xanthobacteraceae bacterium]